MAKDKAPSKPAASAPPPEEKKPIARGHRQRGAGTVIVAKAAVVTADGVTLKAHERLPFQLLHEFCQRERRPIPKYQQCPASSKPPNKRMRVLLEDAKNSKFDMAFCPVQAFDTDSMAKDYAALLALFHFQRSLPLERKLPQPYASSWLEMVNGTSAVTNSTEEEAIVKESSTVCVVDNGTANWLCSQCGIENQFATLAGAPRRKCFKCSAPKTDDCIIVNSISQTATSTKTIVAASKVANLRAAADFVSEAAKEAAELATRSERNKNLSYLDALRKANAYQSIDLSASMLERLQRLLLFDKPDGPPGNSKRIRGPGQAMSKKDIISEVNQLLHTFGVDESLLEYLRSCLVQLIACGASAAACALLDYLLCTDTEDEPLSEDASQEEDCLQAIYADDLVTVQYEHGGRALRCLQLSSTTFTLHLIHSLAVAYPAAMPVVFVTSNDHAQGMNRYLQEMLETKWAEQCVGYDLFTAMQEYQDEEGNTVGAASAREVLDTLWEYCGLVSPAAVEVTMPADITPTAAAPVPHAATKPQRRGQRPAEGMKKKGLHPFWTSTNLSYRSRASPAMAESRRKLPAFGQREVFLDYLSTSQCIIVTGETGCGKTTQIPQYVLEAQPACKIIIAQPRRLAAIAVAQRLSAENGSTVGESVGYMVKGDVKGSMQTQIMLMTYGVLLRRLQEDPLLTSIDVIVLDEVHERGLDSDFCLALLLPALRARPKLQLILMSATIATDHFQSYLLRQLHMHQAELSLSPLVPVLTVPGFTFPVAEVFKDDFVPLLEHFPLAVKPPRGGGKDVDLGLIVTLLCALLVGWNGSEGIAALESGSKGKVRDGSAMMARSRLNEGVEGTVLIFLPGVREINVLVEALQENIVALGKKVEVLPLHSGLTAAQQSRALAPLSSTVRIVVATNIAEASLTLPAVTVVIDGCKVRQIEHDSELGSDRLLTRMAPQSSLLQRAGRAGRVCPGRVYRLITRRTFTVTPLTGAPEMTRVALDRVVLQCHAMSQYHSDLLDSCLDPPSAIKVQACEEHLSRLRALSQGQITSLGKTLTKLACAPHIGRLLLMSVGLKCVYDGALLAAALVVKNPFLQGPSVPNEDKLKVQQAMAKFSSSKGLRSDPELFVRIAMAFEDSPQPRKFCAEHGLLHDRMVDLLDTKADLLSDLVDSGMLPYVRDYRSHACNRYGLSSKGTELVKERLAVFHAVCVSGLYPNIAFVLRPPKRFVEVMGSAFERDVAAREVRLFAPLYRSEDAQVDDDGPNQPLLRKVLHFPTPLVCPMAAVQLSNSSLNSTNTSLGASCAYVVYGEKFIQQQGGGSKGTMCMLSTTSEVSPWAMALFTGALSWTQGVASIDEVDFIRFACDRDSYTVLRRLQEVLDGRLFADESITEEQLQLDDEEVLQTVVELLMEEREDKDPFGLE